MAKYYQRKASITSNECLVDNRRPMSKALFQLSTTLLITTMLASAATKIDKTEYAGWPNCYRLSNGEVELIVTTDIGPRVMRYAFVHGKNMFANFKEELGTIGESEWKGRGGHRVWAAPEVKPDTYALDNGPVTATISGNSITLTQPIEPETHLQKQMTVALDPEGTRVVVTHTLTNKGLQSKHVAVWALTMMAPGGIAIAALPPRGTHDEVLAPTNPLTMWAYTDFSDKRWTFTKKYVMLKQDPHNPVPQKTGLFNPKTFAAYLLGDDLFTKSADADPNSHYPDFHCSYEMFTNDQFLEIETLGPLVNLAADRSLVHVETWRLMKGVHLPGFTDDELDRTLKPLMK
jgi:hypothetical protein